MSSSSDRNDITTSTHHRRASFSPGTTLTELFTGRSAPAPYPGPNVTAAQRARRISISGVPSSNNMTTAALRRGSVSSINSMTSSSSNLDDNAIDDSEGGSPPNAPISPFARRMSFGARALRDVKLPGRHGGPGSPTANRGAWPDNSGKISPPPPPAGENPRHQRRPSVSTMPLPVTALPASKPFEIDPLQERMLKGDFYMD